MAEGGVEEEEHGIILSENLLQELGGQNNDGTQLMTAGKKKRKVKGEPEPGPEVVAAAKKRSKSEQKKLDQIKLRKDKEEKREEYLNVLHKHEISDAHRQLLTSTKDIGQSLTMKAALKKTLKRYKAGLAITEEEHDLLFPRNHQEGGRSSVREEDDEDDDDDQDMPVAIVATAVVPADRDSSTTNSKANKKRTNDAVTVTLITAADTEEETTTLPIDFNDIFDENGACDGEGTADKAKKKKRKKGSTKGTQEQSAVEEHEETTTNAVVPVVASKKQKTNAAAATASSGSSSGSVGSSLMQQLQKFKQKLKSGEVNSLSTMGTDVVVMATATATSSAPLNQRQPSGGANEPDDLESGKAVYVPVSIEEPIDATGRIHISSLPHASTSSSSSSNSSSSSSTRKGPAISVVRDSKIQAARLNLPVCGMEQEIVEAISLNDVVILCGETGSGKSTQVPQFLYEAGFGNHGLIGITQPRRVAATSTAERVAEELSEPITNTGSAARRQHKDKPKGKNEKHNEKKQRGTAGDHDIDDAEDSDDNDEKASAATAITRREGSLVAYQIRFDASTVGDRTRIKFMTDGILLREVTADLLLRQYSVILLDEAHERNVNTDILLGMLSRALPMRRAQAAAEQAKWTSLTAAEREQYAEPMQPLKLVIMSATMRVEDFSTPRLFPAPPPVLRVEARQYPVTVHFSRRTELQDYLQETYKKICQIHRRLPDGGILVFLTGKREIHHMCRKVARALNRQKDKDRTKDGDTRAPTVNDDRIKSRIQSARASGATVSTARTSRNDYDDDDNGDGGGRERKSTSGVTGSRDAMETAAGLGLGVLRGLDEDEMEGDMLDSGDGDDGDDYSDADNGESDSDGSGYDSLGEEEILKEEEELQRKKLDEMKRQDKAKEEEEPDEENLGDGEEIRRRMLQKVLGITAVAENKATDGKSAVLVTGAISSEPTDVIDKDNAGEEGLGSGIAPNSYTGVHVLPLFAMMTAEEQRRVFRSPPKGKRLVVIATNVAETSITIPGVRYVVDCGRQKERVINLQSGVSKFEVRWVAQASAEQRAGRAGRTGPGHCYRLYSSAYFDQHMARFQPPEIFSTPLEDLLLNMRALGIREIENFPFPSPPPPASLKRALDLLTHIGAISQPRRVKALDLAAMAIAAKASSSSAPSSSSALQQVQQQLQLNKQMAGGKLTELGKLIAQFPLTPRFAKMLVVAHRSDVLAHALAFVSILAERSPYDALRQGKKKKKGKGQQDASKDNKKMGDDYDSDGDESNKEENEEDNEDDQDEDEGPPAVEPASSLWYHPEGDALSRLRALGAFGFTSAKARRQVKATVEERDSRRAQRLRQQQQHSAVEQSQKKKKSRGVEQPPAATADKEKPSKDNGTGGSNGAEEEAQFAADIAGHVSQLPRLCSAHGLHQTTLQRSLDLQGQLARTCAQIFSSLSDDRVGQQSLRGEEDKHTRAMKWTAQLLEQGIAPPSKQQEMALRQVLLTGHGDCVARRAPLGAIKTGSRRHRLTAYLSSDPALTQEPLYIHPQSVMYRSDPTADDLPEWVVYAGPSALLKNARGDATYMTCVTPINPAWIPALVRDCPLLHWSAFLPSPAPSYDAKEDCIMCYAIPKFGAHGWELAPVKRPLVECLTSTSSNGGDDSAAINETAPIGFRRSDEPFRWFARYLLEGSVLPELMIGGASAVLSRDKLKDAPIALTQMKPNARVSGLLRALVTRDVHSRKTLLTALQTDPQFLSSEIQEFLAVDSRKEFRKQWAKLHQITF